MDTQNKAIILLSGGIDSAVCAKIAQEWGHELYAISFDYGQKHINELEYAKIIADEIGAMEHKIFKIDAFGEITNEQPYVPARNTIFLAYALGYAEQVGASNIFIGINADDGYFPDCGEPFFHAFIVKEREEHPKHGRTQKHDIYFNHRGQLINAVQFILTNDRNLFPRDWDLLYMKKLEANGKIRNLVIAGSLIAAEIDRLQNNSQ